MPKGNASSPNLTAAERAKLLAAIRAKIVRQGLQEPQWVNSFADVVDVLCSPGPTPWPYTSMFFILLYGILVEIPVRYGEMILSAPLAATGPLRAIVTAVPRAIEALRSQLTPDELIMLEFVRHNHAHVYQLAFYAQVSSGKIKDSVQIRTLGGPPIRLTHDEVHAVKAKQQAANGSSDHRLALAWARKLRPLIPRIQRAVNTANKSQCGPKGTGRAPRQSRSCLRGPEI